MKGLLSLLVVAAAVPAASATMQPSEPQAQTCSLSLADQAWIVQAAQAWRMTAREYTGATPEQLTLIFFDDACVATSEDAALQEEETWISRPHDGRITLPGGRVIEAGVVSAAAPDYFFMSTPSVWRANAVPERAMGLEALMNFVFVHEATHVLQMPTYGRRLQALAEANSLPETFNDDSIQERFESEPAFARSVVKETALLLAAATTENPEHARRLAQEARDSMRIRHSRWYVGDAAYLQEAEDIFLTLEGSGQWAGYKWMTDADGGAGPVAPQAWTTGWWSQDLGLALVLAVERLGGNEWRRHAFGDGSKTIMQLFDEALAVD